MLQKLNETEKNKLKKILKPIEDPDKGKEYLVELVTGELAANCPFTGNPDFYTLKIFYVPDGYIMELKSVKLYISSFRFYQTTHEYLLNTIFEHFKELLKPRYLYVELDVNIRGGIKTVVRREEGERPKVLGIRQIL